MPLGMMNSGATYTRMMRKLLAGAKNIDHYIDDYLVHSGDWDQRLKSLRDLFQCIRAKKLTMRPFKCGMGFRSFDFVGDQIGGQIGLHKANVKKTQEVHRPQAKKHVRSILGLTRFYREYFPN